MIDAWIAPALALVLCLVTNWLQVWLAHSSARAAVVLVSGEPASRFSDAQKAYKKEIYLRSMLDADRLQLLIALVGIVPAVILEPTLTKSVVALIVSIYTGFTVIAYAGTGRLSTKFNPSFLGVRPLFLVIVIALIVAWILLGSAAAAAP